MDIQKELRDSRIKAILSALWITFFINHFFMGLHELANPEFFQRLVVGLDVPDALLLVAAITIQPPIFMIALALILPTRINGLINIIVGFYAILMEAGNVLTNNPDADNWFFFAMEMLSYISIIVISFRWRRKLKLEAGS